MTKNEYLYIESKRSQNW